MHAARLQRLEKERLKGNISGRAIRRLKKRKIKGRKETPPWKGKRKNIRVCQNPSCEKEKNKKKMRKDYQGRTVCKSHGL